MTKYYVDLKMGTGGNIAFYHVANYLKTNYPDDYEFNILSPYFDIGEVCPAIKHVYKPNEARDFIFDAKEEDGIIIEHRLYDMSDFIYKRLNYSQAWFTLLGIPKEKWPNIEATADSTPTTLTSNFDVYSKYSILKQQVDNALAEIKKHGYKNFIIVQFEGGFSPLTQVPVDPKTGAPDWSKVPKVYDNEPLCRIYPQEMATEFVNLFHQEHPDTAIINFALPNERDYPNTLKFIMPYLCYYELANAKNCIGTVSIDSCLQHLVAGITKSVVMWHHTLPNSFGYIYNKNLIAKCRRDDILYFTALGKSGAKVDYITPSDLLIEVDSYLFPKASIDKESKC